MTITIEVWKVIVLIVLAAPVVNLGWYWALKSILRAPADIKDYFAKLRQA